MKLLFQCQLKAHLSTGPKCRQNNTTQLCLFGLLYAETEKCRIRANVDSCSRTCSKSQFLCLVSGNLLQSPKSAYGTNSPLFTCCVLPIHQLYFSRSTRRRVEYCLIPHMLSRCTRRKSYTSKASINEPRAPICYPVK